MVASTISVPRIGKSRSRLPFSSPPSEHNEKLSTLIEELDWDGLEADVYLAFIGSSPLQLSGFLVTRKSNIDEVIALCPVEIDTADPKRSYRDLHKQLQLA